MPKPNPAPNTGDATADHGLSSVFSDIAGPNSAGVRYTPTPKPEPRRRSSKGKKPRRSITGDDRVDDVLESRGDDIRGVDSSDPFSSQNQKRNRQRQRQYIDPSTGNPLPPGQITGDPQADRNIREVERDVNPQLKVEAQKAINGIDDLLGNIFQKKRAVVGGGNVSGNQGGVEEAIEL